MQGSLTMDSSKAVRYPVWAPGLLAARWVGTAHSRTTQRYEEAQAAIPFLQEVLVSASSVRVPVLRAQRFSIAARSKAGARVKRSSYLHSGDRTASPSSTA